MTEPAVKFKPKYRRHLQDQLTVTGELAPAIHRPLPPVLKNPLKANELETCFNCVRFESYSTCEFCCIYCFARGYSETLYAAFYDFEKPSDLDVPRPASLEQPAKMFTDAYERTSSKEMTVKAIRKGVPIHMSVLCDPMQPQPEKEHKISLQFVQMAQEYDHPIVMSSKSDLHRTNPWFKVFSESTIKVMQTSISVWDEEKAKQIEPLASSPKDRLDTLADYVSTGMRGVVRVSPNIPKVTEWERIIDESAKRGIKRLMFSSLFVRKEFVRGLTKIAGYDVLKYYKTRPHLETRGACLHLAPSEIATMANDMFQYARDVGMRANVDSPCWFYLEADDYNCCGIDGLVPQDKMNRVNFRDASLEVMRHKKLTWQEYKAMRRGHFFSKAHLHANEDMWKNLLQQVIHMKVLHIDEDGFPVYQFVKDDPRIEGVDFPIVKS